MTRDVFEAGQLAQQLEIQNRERQQITREIQAHAEGMALAEDPEALILIAVHPEYNPGVVGLAASRLTDQFYRPAIVAQQGEEFTRGSCRSISEFHITQALDECAELLEHHGGHAAAAGFTIRNENLPEFIERLKSIAKQELEGLDLRPTLNADLDTSAFRIETGNPAISGLATAHGLWQPAGRLCLQRAEGEQKPPCGKGRLAPQAYSDRWAHHL